MDNPLGVYYFFFNDAATTEIYTLSPHDALPIYRYAAGAEKSSKRAPAEVGRWPCFCTRKHQSDSSRVARKGDVRDRKSTRLNSSHSQISYAVFCLKKKSETTISGSNSMNTCRAS